VIKVEKCPKCGGKMVRGSGETLSNCFDCTRPPPDSEKQAQYDHRIQPHYCETCGYIEFYREKKE
jgi:predicted nucleic-acid-binding Zn-ribbon protein